jgi:hypothetical protein
MVIGTSQPLLQITCRSSRVLAFPIDTDFPGLLSPETFSKRPALLRDQFTVGTMMTGYAQYSSSNATNDCGTSGT